MFHKLEIVFLSSFIHQLFIITWCYFSCFLELSLFPVIFSINNSYFIPRRWMASGFHMLWKASYLFIFSRFFSIILMFFPSFFLSSFQFSVCFTCILFKTIITVCFINYILSFHFILLFYSNVSILCLKNC